MKFTLTHAEVRSSNELLENLQESKEGGYKRSLKAAQKRIEYCKNKDGIYVVTSLKTTKL